MNKTFITRFIIGLGIITAGALVLLNNLEIVDTGELVSKWWPTLVILAGLLIVLNDKSAYIWALVVAGIGGVMLARTAGGYDIDVWSVAWPVVLVAIGVSIIKDGFIARKKPAPSASVQETYSALLSGIESRNDSQEFTRARLSAVLGGTMVDLRDAKMKDNEAYIEVFALLGGIELRVPAEWEIRNESTAILGGVEVTSGKDAKTKNAPVLHVRGQCILGGVEVKR